MKKVISLIALPLLLLASCSGKDENSSSFENSSPISSSSNSSQITSESELDEELAASIINKLGNGESFNLTYLETLNSEAEDFYSSDYVYFNSDGLGYVLLDVDDEKRPFTFFINDNDEIELGVVAGNSTDSLSSLTSLKYLSSNPISASDLTMGEGNYIYNSTNSYLIHSFANLIGLSDYYSSISSVDIYFDNFNNFSYRLNLEGYNITNEEVVIGTVSDIGTAKIDSVENFKDSFSLSDEVVSDNALKRLLSTTFQSKIVATSTEVDSGREEIVANYELRYTPTEVQFKQSYSGYDRGFYYSKKTSVNEQGIPQDSVGQRSYVDHNNELIDVETTARWADVTETFAYKVFNQEKADIRKASDGSYVYVGMNSDDLFMGVSQFESKGTIGKLEFKVENDVIVGMTVTTVPFSITSSSSYFILTYEVEFAENPEAPMKPAPYEAQGEAGADTEKIKKAFDFFSNPTTHFSIDVSETYGSTSMNYEGIYDGEAYYYHQKGSLSGNGYVLKTSGKILPFVIDSNGSATATTPEKTGTIADVAGFTIAPECFVLDSDGKTIRDRDIGIENPLDYMFIGDSEISYGYQGTGITMTLNGDGLLGTMSYITQILNPVDGSYASIYVTYTYSYGDDITMNSSVKSKLQNLEFVAPTTWGEESRTLTYAIQKLLDDEDYDVDFVLPYVYRDWLTTYWTDVTNTTSGQVLFYVFNDDELDSISQEEKDAYYNDLKEAFVEMGYSVTTDTSETVVYTFSRDDLPFTVTVYASDYSFSEPIVISKK